MKNQKLNQNQNNELSLEDIAKYDLVGIADLLLKSSVENSKILEKKNGWDEMDIKKARTILGYLNALQNCFGRKLQQIKLDTNISNKVKVVEKLRKNGHFK